MDIAVGAYKSGHAIILRSKPVTKTQLLIETIPNTLQRDARQFLIKVCLYFVRNVRYNSEQGTCM